MLLEPAEEIACGAGFDRCTRFNHRRYLTSVLPQWKRTPLYVRGRMMRRRDSKNECVQIVANVPRKAR